MKLTCTKCNKEKNSKLFRKDQHNPTGHHCHCNTCFNKSQRNYYNNNLDKVRDYANSYYKKNAKRISDLRKARRVGHDTTQLFKVTNSEKLENQSNYYKRLGWKKSKENRWKSQGIKDFTYNQFEEMVILQNNKCYLCNSDPAKNQMLHVDHDHITGKVRKLLCNNCNNGMGKLKDDVQLIQKVLLYLNQHNKHE